MQLGQTFGANPPLNEALAIATGYSGDFGGGLWGQWINQQSASMQAMAQKIIAQYAAPLPPVQSGDEYVPETFGTWANDAYTIMDGLTLAGGNGTNLFFKYWLPVGGDVNNRVFTIAAPMTYNQLVTFDKTGAMPGDALANTSPVQPPAIPDTTHPTGHVEPNLPNTDLYAIPSSITDGITTISNAMPAWAKPALITLGALFLLRR